MPLLKIASLKDINKLKEIMYNEEIKEKEKYGFDFSRRFKTYVILHLLRFILKPLIKKEINLLSLKDQKKILGGLILSVDYSKRTAFISHVSIAKEFRGKGLGSFMINEAISFLKNKKIKKVELSTDIDNEVAKKIYLKNGFRIEGLIYQIPGKHFFRQSDNNIINILYKILLNEKRICYEKEDIKILWTKTNKGWYTFVQSSINKKKYVEEMIKKKNVDLSYVKKEVVFSYWF